MSLPNNMGANLQEPRRELRIISGSEFSRMGAETVNQYLSVYFRAYDFGAMQSDTYALLTTTQEPAPSGIEMQRRQEESMWRQEYDLVPRAQTQARAYWQGAALVRQLDSARLEEEFQRLVNDINQNKQPDAKPAKQLTLDFAWPLVVDAIADWAAEKRNVRPEPVKAKRYSPTLDEMSDYAVEVSNHIEHSINCYGKVGCIAATYETWAKDKNEQR